MEIPGFEKLAVLVQQREAEGITKHAIAEEMGASPPLLSQWLSKKLRPGVGFVHRIEKWSARFGRDRVIRTEDWLDAADRESLSRVGRRARATPPGKGAA